MELKYQNLAILLMWTIGAIEARRVKRLSSPEFHGDTTMELAKYVVSIRSRTPRTFFGDNHYCGGGLISRRWVLTAAHCVMDRVKVMFMPRMLLVVSGAPHRLRFVKDQTICSPVQSLHVPKQFIMHNTMNLALIYLTTSLPVDNPNIGYLLLPMSPPKIGATYSILGWGRMYSLGPLASEIFQLDVALMDPTECQLYFKNFHEGILCAGKNNLTLDADPCSGDIGAPLIRDRVVVGIVSYPLGCGSETLPSVYTDVYSNLPWIMEKMEEISSLVVRGPKPILVLIVSSILVVLAL